MGWFRVSGFGWLPLDCVCSLDWNEVGRKVCVCEARSNRGGGNWNWIGLEA